MNFQLFLASLQNSIDKIFKKKNFSQDEENSIYFLTKLPFTLIKTKLSTTLKYWVMERDANKFRLVTFSIINKNFNAFSFLFFYFFQIVIFCLSDCIGIEIINRANYRLYRFKLTNNGRG